MFKKILDWIKSKKIFIIIGTGLSIALSIVVVIIRSLLDNEYQKKVNEEKKINDKLTKESKESIKQSDKIIDNNNKETGKIKNNIDKRKSEMSDLIK